MPSQSFANPLNCLTNTSANSVQCVPNSSTAPTTVNTVAIGAYSAVSANFGIAVGNFTEVHGGGGTALGFGAYVSEEAGDSIAIGSVARTHENTAIAIGASSNGWSERSVTIGPNAGAVGPGSIAIGSNAGEIVNDAPGNEKAGNVMIGLSAGGIIGGEYNNYIGQNSGSSSWGSENSGMGSSAGMGLKGDQNNFMGELALFGAEGNNNIAFGERAGLGVIGDSNISIGKNAGAGVAEYTKGISIGESSLANKDHAIAVGTDAKTEVVSGAALGSYSIANRATNLPGYVPGGGANTAIAATTLGKLGAISVGSATATRQITNLAAGSKDSDAVNVAQLKAAQTHYYSVKSTNQAVGSNYLNDGATGFDALAAGVNTFAKGSQATALGTKSTANTVNSIAIGFNSIAGVSGTNSAQIALGNNAKADNGRAIAIGPNTNAIGMGSAAIGNAAIATGQNALAMMNGANANGRRAIAIGYGAYAGGDTTTSVDADILGSPTAVGQYARATTYRASAFGTQASAYGDGATAVGVLSVAASKDTVAIGNKSFAFLNNDVAIGSRSIAAGAEGTTSATVGPFTYGGFAGSTPIATVSIGKVGEERTLTNLAAGRIDATSTDGINGSQLYATNQVIGNLADSIKTILGGNANFPDTKDGTITTSNIGDTTKNDIHEAIKASTEAAKMPLIFAGDSGDNVSRKLGETVNVVGGITDASKLSDNNIGVVANGVDTLEVKLAKDLRIDSVTAGNTVLNKEGVSIKDGPSMPQSGITVGNTVINNAGVSIKDGPSMAQSGINAGGKTITNVAPGVNPTDAVNVSQLSAAINNNLAPVHSRIDSVAKDAFGGTASAMASAGLPQAYMPGKSMVAIAGSTFKSQSAIALGVSSITDNGKWVIKGTVNSNSRGDFGATIGTGYQW